jgi:hypothetical protein
MKLLDGMEAVGGAGGGLGFLVIEVDWVLVAGSGDLSG